MTFKRGKDQAISAACCVAQMAVQHQLSSMSYTPMGPMTDFIGKAIDAGIKAAITALVHEMYTDAEFEQDIGINDGNSG